MDSGFDLFKLIYYDSPTAQNCSRSSWKFGNYQWAAENGAHLNNGNRVFYSLWGEDKRLACELCYNFEVT
jgi:hypothetical protein